MKCNLCGSNVSHLVHQELCNRCYRKKYYMENVDRIRNKRHEYYLENIDKKKEYDRNYRPRKPRNQWKKRDSFHGPCVNCKKISMTCRYVRGLCIQCYKKMIYHDARPKEERYCRECGKKLTPYTRLELCYPCNKRKKYRESEEYRDKCKQYNKQYKKTENGRALERKHVLKRRAQLARVEFTLTVDEWEEIKKRYNCCCAYCGKKKKLEMDHVIPISKGGPTTKENIVPACRNCNSSKGNREKPILIS